MKRYSLIVMLHIAGIVLLSIGIYLLIEARLWFSALMASFILTAVAIHLYRMQMVQVRMMRHLAESLRYDDMMKRINREQSIFPYDAFLPVALSKPLHGRHGQ